MPDWSTSNNKGLAIVRISSRKQEGNTSHDTQEAEIRDYCSRYGIELVEVHRIVESAKDDEQRKKYTAAIQKVLAESIYHVLFYMYDREARNIIDVAQNEKLVNAGLICLHYVRENKALHRGSADSDFFIRDVQAVVNRQFIRTHTTKIRDAIRKKVESGWYPGSRPPLGYHCVRDESGRSYVRRDPKEKNVQWVQREFELRSQGHTYDEVRTRIISEGFVPKEQIPRYQLRSVEYRLKNPFYWGRFRWEGHEYPGKHELIIPTHILDQVSRVSRGYVHREIDPAQEHGLLAYGAFLKCVCGCSVVYEPKQKTYRSGKTQVFHYYRCTNGKKLHEKREYIREDILWSMIDQLIDSITLSPELAERIAHRLNGTHRGAVAQAGRVISEAKAKLKELRDRDDRATALLIDGTLERDAFARARVEIQSESRQWQAKLESAQFQATGRYHETVQSTVELCKRAKSLYESRTKAERRMFIEKLVSNLRLDGATLHAVWRKPFESLVDLKKKGNGGDAWDKFLTDCSISQGGILGESVFIEKFEDQSENSRT
jgi:site-specific DNA recombinase